jgi:protein ImuB
MLWIAVRLHSLPLAIFLRSSPLHEPFAVTERQRVHACDAKASARGVRPGMTASAAQALAPRLRLRERDPAGETEALLGLAAWATQFTPSVALDFPDGLALEVEGSTRLFGGIEPLLAQMRTGLDALGYAAQLAVAPTCRAAAWLSRVPHDVPLDEVPLAALRLPVDIAAGIATLGVQTVGALRALPRDGLANRFGPQLVLDLDRARGLVPEPRSWFAPPERFEATLELLGEVTQTEALLFAFSRLFAQLAAFLAGRTAGVPSFVLRLQHREGRVTELTMGLVAPSRDAKHFALLTRERLASLKLAEPVRSIALCAGRVVPLAGTNASLFIDAKDATEDWSRLVERLRARIGAEAVHALSAVPDHRPEHASRALAVGQKPQSAQPGPRAGSLTGERPFWLLDTPRPIDEIGSVPHWRGPLRLLTGAERIRSGWWDGAPVARDYFIARTAEGAFVWVYRERSVLEGGRWYLHGLFA